MLEMRRPIRGERGVELPTYNLGELSPVDIRAYLEEKDVVMIPIVQQNWIYGVRPKLKFKPLPNGQLPVAWMSLTS